MKWGVSYMTEKCQKIMELYYEAVYAEDKRKSCWQKACATVNVQWNASSSTARFDGHDPYWKEESRKWDWKNYELRQEIDRLMDEDVKREIKSICQEKKQSYSNLENQVDRERARAGINKGESALYRKKRFWDSIHGIMCGVLVISWIITLGMWFLIGCDALTNTWPDQERALYLTIGYWLLGISVASIFLYIFALRMHDKSLDVLEEKNSRIKQWENEHGNQAAIAKLKSEYEQLDKMIRYLGL